MKRFLLSILASMFIATAASAQEIPNYDSLSNAEIEAQATDLHPVALYMLSYRLLHEGNGVDAANWMYAGQLRYRFLLAAEGDAARNDAVLFDALSEQVGRPVNEYIGGNVDEWLAAMQWALDWDAANPNNVISKTEHADALEQVRTGLQGLMEQVEANRDTIPDERTANGLENR